MQKKTIGIIGSTGSIGCFSVDILKNNLDKFDIKIILGFNNYELIIKQAILLKPEIVFISKKYIKNLYEAKVNEFSKIFSTEDFSKISHQYFANQKIDIVILSVRGFFGLKFCIDSSKISKRICLANKESIICGGNFLMNQIKECEIIPIDSEHNTIFQMINNNYSQKENISEIIITASGGPFFQKIHDNKINELIDIDFNQARKHPNWSMGLEISINSATLMNKAQELIEAFYLFKIKNLKAIIHPESIVHAIINYQNGMSIMGASYPNMSLHISHGIFYNNQNSFEFKNINFAEIKTLNFFEIKNWPFNYIDIAYEIIRSENLTLSIILNALNEIALELFINKKIKFFHLTVSVNLLINT